MKTTVLSIIAICALAAVSCQEIEPEFTATKTQTITLRAQIDPETKTTYGSDVTFGWSAGDAISLLVKNADNSYSFIELTTTDSGASADFTGTLLAGQTVQDLALYPASENHVYTNDGTETIQFYLPTSYDYTTHESVNLPMVARKSAGTYTFKPAGGALKVTYNNLPGNTVLDFQFASDNKLNGLMELTDDKLPTCSYDGAGVDAHAIVVKARTDASGNATIYYPMPPKTDNGYNRLRIMWDGTTTRLYNKQNNGAAYKIPIAVGQITRLKAISFSHSPATESDFTKAKAGLSKGASGDASWKRGMRLVKLAYDDDNIYGYIEVDLGKDNVTRMNYLCVAVDNDGVHEGQSTSWIFNNYKGYDNWFVVAEEGFPEAEHLQKQLKQRKQKKVNLIPFTFAAENSQPINQLTQTLQKAGYKVTQTTHTLGEADDILNLFIQHARHAQQYRSYSPLEIKMQEILK